LAGEELFRRFAQKYEEAKDPNKAHKFKYIIWGVPRAGWGNVLSDQASGLTYALLTDRLIYLNTANYDSLLTTSIPAWQDWNAQQRILNSTTEGRSCLGNRTSTRWGGQFYTSWLVNDHRSDSECIQSLSGQGDYMTPTLAANIHYEEFFKNYTTNYDAFHFVANQMWKPAEAVQKEMDKTLPELLKYKYKIGIHIRKHKWAQLKNNFPYREFCDLALGLATTSGLNQSEIVIFAGTDSPKESLPILEKCVHPYRFMHTTPSEGRSSAKNPGSDFSAIVDLFIMSKCNDILSTIGSSYSEVAAGFGKITPWHIQPGDHDSPANPAFYKQLNSEPCMFLTRKWRKVEGEKMRSFQLNGMWRQYEACHPDPDRAPNFT